MKSLNKPIYRLLKRLYYDTLVYKDLILYYYKNYYKKRLHKDLVSQDLLVDIYKLLCELERKLRGFK